MAERVLLKTNARDQYTHRSYRAGVYEVVQTSERRDQMDRSFAQRVLESGLAEEYVPNATADALTLAEDNGLDVETIEGSGTGGRVTVTDVRAAIKAREDEPKTPEETPAPPPA